MAAARNVNPGANHGGRLSRIPLERSPRRRREILSSRSLAWASVRGVVVGLVLLGLPACRYHIGHPAPSVGLTVGEIQAPVVEPGLADALAASLAASIRRAGAEGERHILTRIDRASFEAAVSREGQVHAWTATLEVTFVLDGARPRELSLQRSLVVATPPGGVAPTELRQPALEQLAAVVADEAVSTFLYAPKPPPDPR